MGARQRFVISLADVTDTDEPLVGGKAARLAALARAGFAVPGGFCLTIEAYQRFLTAAQLGDLIGMELGRKAFADMRWEEIWDASLRIRSAFTAAAVPSEIASEIADAMSRFPRQLVGQPAAPGLETGRVRRIRTTEDLGQFQAGEVLVCDAIQPMMTHLVPLAAAVVERRGGMLIHGAIIARELGLPCVNGVAGAIELLHDGDIITVDGYLGIVTVGAPEFELELANVAGDTDSRKSRNGA